MSNDIETGRRVTKAFEAAAERLKERGVSDGDIGRSMVAVGLSFWSRVVTRQELTERLADLTLSVAEAAGIDPENPAKEPSRH